MTHPGIDSCGCCAGIDADTPARIDNPAGQPAVAYRVGVHAQFKTSLMARLSSADLRALGALATRDDDDFTIALCDALATTLDVLAFYQERIANENLLRTATERRSILELARLIGYRLAPGVAASGHLAFTLQEVPGSPALAAAPVDIPVGTRVQSVPGPGEHPQTFETVEVVEARTEWNAIPVQASAAWHPAFGDTHLWITGVENGVRAGDVIVVVGQERIDDPASKRWDVRKLAAVTEDLAGGRTRLAWTEPLGRTGPHVEPAAMGATVHVFRQRAALFGFNAPDPRLMATKDLPLLAAMLDSSGKEWKGYSLGTGRFDLDSDYPKVIPGSWVALVAGAAPPAKSGLVFKSFAVGPVGIEAAPSLPEAVGAVVGQIGTGPVVASVAMAAAGDIALYRATSVAHLTRRDYGFSAKTTRISPDTSAGLAGFGLRETMVLAQSEELPVAETPLGYPLYGTVLALSRLEPAIGPGRALGVRGKRPRVRVRRGKAPVTMLLEGGGAVTVHEGDSLQMAAPPERWSGGAWATLTPAAFGLVLASPGSVALRIGLIDRNGRRGTLIVAAAAIELGAPDPNDDEVQEIAFVGSLPTAVTASRDRTTLSLDVPLRHCYDRDSARVTANVARATHGESVTEIVGSGDARVPNAVLRLRQSPLTFVSAATPSGQEPTLVLRANDLEWDAVPSLYGCGATDRAYEIDVDDEGTTSVRFGDGTEGARPPSGDHNIRAHYRKGLGVAGNLAGGRLTTLLSRPLGVTGATNPEAATGGEDPEAEDRARINAPLTVLTLDRAVSIRDYRDFARAFAGIAKAHALWLPNGPALGVFLTVAGEGRAAVPPTGDTYRNLQSALHRYGDALMPLTLSTYTDARFRLRLAVKVAPDADPKVVLAAVEACLRAAFAFETRDFGQGTSVDEVAATAQAVAGVEAVNVVELHRSDAPTPTLVPRLFAALPISSLTIRPRPAELLTLADGPLHLDVMP